MNLTLYTTLLKELAQNPKLIKERRKLKAMLKKSKRGLKKLRGGFIFTALALSIGASIAAAASTAGTAVGATAATVGTANSTVASAVVGGVVTAAATASVEAVVDAIKK